MSIGIWQVLLILIIVLIVFGSGKLPKVMEDIARGLKSFRDGIGSESEKKDPKVEILPPQRKKNSRKK